VRWLARVGGSLSPEILIELIILPRAMLQSIGGEVRSGACNVVRAGCQSETAGRRRPRGREPAFGSLVGVGRLPTALARIVKGSEIRLVDWGRQP
jgi:hypothetical protein